jgi:hypothetical protein
VQLKRLAAKIGGHVLWKQAERRCNGHLPATLGREYATKGASCNQEVRGGHGCFSSAGKTPYGGVGDD